MTLKYYAKIKKIINRKQISEIVKIDYRVYKAF